MSAQMSAEELEALPVTISLPTAGRVFGMSRSHSYDAYSRGEFPVRVLSIGGRLRVSKYDVLATLGAPADGAAGGAR